MAKNKKPGKKYRPRPVLPDPMGHLQWRMALVGERAMGVLVQAHTALAELVQGNASVRSWNVVGDAINVAKAIDRQCYGALYADTIEAAMEAHAQCGVRRLKSERFGYTGAQLAAVNAAMELHEAMLKASTNAELERALALVEQLRLTEPVDPHQMLTA